MTSIQQKYNLYHSLTNPFQSYEEEKDRLWFDPEEYTIDITTMSPLDEIFHRHNMDDRPDGQKAPSLSVGDVIALDFPEDHGKFYAVDNFGFTEVGDPWLDQIDLTPNWADAPITRT